MVSLSCYLTLRTIIILLISFSFTGSYFIEISPIKKLLKQYIFSIQILLYNYYLEYICILNF